MQGLSGRRVRGADQGDVGTTKLAKLLVSLLHRHAHRLVFLLGPGRELIGHGNEVGIHLLGLDVGENDLGRSFDARRDTSSENLTSKFRSRLCG